MKLQDKLRGLRASGGALLATNYYNYETLAGVVAAVADKKCSVILQLTASSINYMGLAPALNLGKTMLKTHGVNGWIHLDHGGSVELVKMCLDAGFDSVMIDASEKPFAENIETTRTVVQMAENYGANVEAELGYVPKLGQQTEKITFTQPEDAQKFAQETGVNALAVAIGSQHGFYKGEPKIDLDLLAEIKDAVNIPLVLHGGSGIPDQTLRGAIERGICKVNIATEIKNTFMQSVKTIMADNEDIDLRNVFPPAIRNVENLINKKLDVVY